MHPASQYLCILYFGKGSSDLGPLWAMPARKAPWTQRDMRLMSILSRIGQIWPGMQPLLKKASPKSQC
jgi:hypothetical protein